jgi:hypothetical protein
MKKQTNKPGGETVGWQAAQQSVFRETRRARIAPLPLFFCYAWVVLAAALAANVSAQSSPGKAPPKAIHGEPIDAGSPAVPAPALDVKPGAAAATQPAASGTNATPAPAVGESAKPGYLTVGFDKLASYEYTAPDVQVTNLTNGIDEADKFIPAEVKGLDGKKAVIKGFMLPLKVEAGKVTEFLIMRNQGACCFGVPPKITELVMVKAPEGKGVKPIMDQPVDIEGTLHIGTARENGYIVGIYRMDGERMVGD